MGVILSGMKSAALAFFLACALLPQTFARAGMEFIRRELPWGHPISLEAWGGPPIEVSIRSRQVSFVTVEIADFTRMVPVLVNDATIYGPSRVVMQPTRATRRVEKKNGTPVPGGRSDMFLLYSEPSTGVQVFFSDEAGGQNRDVVVIGVPRGSSSATSATPALRFRPEPPAPRARNDGYLSDKLLDWYLRLSEKRERLDLNDRDAVQRFNDEAARYHAEVKRARLYNAASR